MKKLMKWGLILLGALIVLLIAAVMILPRVIDVQKYKPEIEQKASNAMKRPVTLGGEIDLSLFPWVGVGATDVRIGNPPEFQEKEFVTVGAFEIHVKLIPLLSRDIQVKNLILKNPSIILERTKDGKANWEGLGPTEEGGPREQDKAPQEEPGEIPIDSLAVDEFTIDNGAIIWIDHSRNERHHISQVNISVEDLSFDRPIGLALSAELDGHPVSLKGKIGPLGKAPWKGTIPFEISIGSLRAVQVNMDGQVTDPAVEPHVHLDIAIPPFSPREVLSALDRPFPLVTSDPKALTSIALQAQIEGSRESVSISKGILNVDESNMTFLVEAKDFSKPDIHFELEADQIEMDRYLPHTPEQTTERGTRKQKDQETKGPSEDNPKASENPGFGAFPTLALDGHIRLGTLKVQGAQFQDFQLKIAGKQGVFLIDPVSVKLPEGSASVRGTVNLQQETPHFDLDVQVTPFSPRKLFEATGRTFPLQTVDPDALTRMSLNTKIQGSTEKVTVERGSLDIDESHFSFSGTAKEFQKPDVRFRLKVDQIDLDRYMPPPETQPQKDAEVKERKRTKESQPSETKAPTYSQLRELVLDATVQATRLKARGVQMQDLDLKVTAADGIIKMAPLALKLYKGAASAISRVNVRGQIPKSELNLEIDGLQVAPFLKDLMDKDFLGGTLDGQMLMQAEGGEARRVKRSLESQGELLFQDGYIRGLDVAGMVRNVKATFGLAEKAEERPVTDFTELRCPFTITGGVFKTSETKLMSPLLRLLAEGTADLVQEILDLRIEPKFVATLKGQGDTAERAGVMVPVLVTGTFSSPKFRPDLEGMIKQRIKEVKIPDLKEGLPTSEELERSLELEETLPTPPVLEGESSPEKQPGTGDLEDKAKDLLKSLPGVGDR